MTVDARFVILKVSSWNNRHLSWNLFRLNSRLWYTHNHLHPPQAFQVSKRDLNRLCVSELEFIFATNPSLPHLFQKFKLLFFSFFLTLFFFIFRECFTFLNALAENGIHLSLFSREPAKRNKAGVTFKRVCESLEKRPD